MKKYILPLLFNLLSITYGWSQQVSFGSLSALHNAGKICLEMDFSQASIHGMDEEAFRNYEQDWEKDKPVVIGKFISGVVSHCGNDLSIGNYKEKEYTIRILVRNIGVKGDYNCDADIMDTSGTTIAKITKIKGKGGKIGSVLNLIKDGAKHTGASLGTFLKKEVNKSSKKNIK